MTKQIEIIVNENGVVAIRNVPNDIEIIVIDKVEDTIAVFGEGDNQILSQRA